MALSPANNARPSSATRAMMWFLRSIDQSLRAKADRSAWGAGITFEPGSCAARASSGRSRRMSSGHEQEQAPAAGLEPPGGQRERADIGHGLDRRLGAGGPFLVQAARQGREALGLEHLPHRRRAERELALLEGLADLVDRVVPLAQGDDGLARGGLLGLGAGPGPWRTQRRRARPGAGSDGTSHGRRPASTRRPGRPRRRAARRRSTRAGPRTGAAWATWGAGRRAGRRLDSSVHPTAYIMSTTYHPRGQAKTAPNRSLAENTRENLRGLTAPRQGPPRDSDHQRLWK